MQPNQQPPGGQYPHPNPYGGGAPPDPLGGPPPGGPPPTGPPPYGGPPGGGYGAPPGGNRPKGRRALIIGVVCVAVVVLAGTGAVALTFVFKDDQGSAPKQPVAASSSPATSPPTTPPASPTETGPSAGSPAPPTGSASRWLKIADRSSDPAPLTPDELFGEHTLSHGKKTGHDAKRRTYKLVERAKTKKCRSAVKGGKLRAALHTYDCDQLLRATYLRTDGKLVGTVGVANLTNSHGAKKAFTSASGGKQYVTPLPGSGKSARVGQGAALGIRQEKGHYLILSWVQYTDGHRPNSAERKKLSQFHEDVVSEAISDPLGYRMLHGKPQK